MSTPLRGARRKIFDFVITNASYLMVLLLGYKVKHIYHSADKFDYTKYLGP